MEFIQETSDNDLKESMDIICKSITIGQWKIHTENVGEKQVLIIRDMKSEKDSRFAFWPDLHKDV